jgi:flagellar motility protein MotE (MotC chaperone)
VAKDAKEKPEASKTENGKQAQGAEAAQQPVKAKKSLMPLLIMGGGGLALLALVMFGTLFFLRGKDKTADTAEAKPAVAVVIDSAHPGKSDVKTVPSDKGLPEIKPTAPESTATTKALQDSVDLLPAQIDTAAAMAALSKTIQVMDDAHQSAHTADSAASSSQDSVKEAAWVTKTREALSQKEAALDARAATLDKREKDVAAKLLRIEQATSDRVTNLAKLYDGMEPAAVAKLMANLDDATVVSLIPRMKQKNASDVMSLLPPARAATISKQIITLADEK